MYSRMYPRKFLRALTLALLAIAVVVALMFSYRTLYTRMVDETVALSLKQLRLLASLIEEEPGLAEQNKFLHIAGKQQVRLTYIDAGGTVVGDSLVPDSNVAALDNHKDRLEFILASKNGYGSAIRNSLTMNSEAIYTALSMENGNYLRLAMPFDSVKQSIRQQFLFLLYVSASLLAVALFMFAFERHVFRKALQEVSRRVGALAQGEFNGPVSSMGWDELQPLVKDINTMSGTIQETIADLTDKSWQLQTIFDSIKEGVAILNRSGGITACNASFLHLFPACTPSRCPQAISCISIPKLQHSIERAVRGEQPEQSSFRYSGAQGEQLFISLYKPAVPAPGAFLVLTVQDVTKLMQLERAQVDFVANVSHELRTPLTAIKGYGEALWHSHYSEEEGRVFASKIMRHADMLHALIEELLALAALDSPEVSVARDIVPLDECLRRACQLIAESGTFSTELIVKTEGSCAVWGSMPLLIQVVRNLLENACTYSPPDKPVVAAACQRGGVCRVTVADQGPGITAEAQKRIFERFYRYEKQRNSAHSGLGLAIARQIVERMGGRIQVESPSRDANTVFTIELPSAEV